MSIRQYILSSLSDFLDGLLEVFLYRSCVWFSSDREGRLPPAMESKFSHYQLGKERRMITVTVKSLLQISFELFTKLVGVSLESLLSLLSRLLGIDSGLVAQTGEVKLTGIIEIIDTSETANPHRSRLQSPVLSFPVFP